ncbi:30S ribosomal protein S12 methylthiotransferase RimO [Mesoaciditoga sp.]
MKVFMSVLGCPKNEADSSVVAAILKKRGHTIVNAPEQADAMVINTCGFIEEAKEESINEIFDLLRYGKRVIVHGCLVQRYFRDLRREIPEVSSFLGVVEPQKVVEAVEKPGDYFSTPNPVYNFSVRDLDGKPYAYLKVGDGCNRKCAFCAIPSFKGPLKNRKVEDILEEAEFLISNGKKEIVLVSQDLTQYEDEGRDLVDLLNDLDKIKGDFWIRLLYLYPDGVGKKLVEFVKNSEHVLHYFDVPIQHASEKILKAMNRNPDVQALREKFKLIKKTIDDVTLRTTAMVGFPTEDDDDFKRLMNFVQEIEFDRLGTFIYSDEEGTLAYALKPKVPFGVMKQRYDELMDYQRDASLERNAKYVGKKFKVLVEGIQEGMYYGRTYMDAPEIDGYVHFSSNRELKVGEFVEVKITDFEFYDLEGVCV